MVHTKLSINDSELINNFTNNTYEINLKSGDKLTIDLSDMADGYTCIKNLEISESDIITFGWDGNYTKDSRLELVEETYEDWGANYSALYGPITYTANSDQTITLTSYLGGSGIDINYDYVIAILASLVILYYAIHTLIYETRSTFLYVAIAFGLSNAIIATYALGVFFKAMNKGKTFEAFSKYLFASIGIIVVYSLVFIISYVIKKKVLKIEDKKIYQIEEEKTTEPVENLNNL